MDTSTDNVKIGELGQINLIHVESISDGWSITFLSEAGDLPLIEATSEKLSNNAKVEATEII